MVEQVDDAADAELLEQLGDLGADASQRFHFGEQRVEDFGPHIRCCHCERSEAIHWIAAAFPGLAMTANCT